VCVVHNCLLVDACPACGKFQRQQQVYNRVPTPSLCACGESLGAVPTVKLRADHAIAQAQREVFDIIDDGATHFGVFAAHRNSRRDVLVAIRSLANRVLNYASTHGLVAVRSTEVSGTNADLLELKPLQARNALNETAPSSAIDVAFGVTAALHILRSRTIKDAAARTRPFIDGQNADTGQRNSGHAPATALFPQPLRSRLAATAWAQSCSSGTEPRSPGHVCPTSNPIGSIALPLPYPP
jgi:hypothetical protein